MSEALSNQGNTRMKATFTCILVYKTISVVARTVKEAMGGEYFDSFFEFFSNQLKHKEQVFYFSVRKL